MSVDGGTTTPSSSSTLDGGGALAAPYLPLGPDSCWPVDTRCIPDWDAYDVEPDPDADPVEPGVPTYSAAQKDLAVALAGQTMRMLTGYRVGGCPIVVRPCRTGCGEQTWTGYASSTGWAPVNLGGTWLNIGCGHTSACGCTGLSEVRLWGPASRVEQVLVDGQPLPPTSYRLDAGGLLVRTDGDRWPLCQNLTLAADQPGTWQVTYLPAVGVDGAGAAAAGALAAEYLKACVGDECGLPTGATQVARNGVTISLTPDVFPEGRTGLPVVDAYVRRWNPHALASPSTVWSPDVRRPRTTL